MKEISFAAGELLLAAAWVLIRVICWIRKGRIDWKRETALMLMYVNLAVIIRFAFYPFSKVNGQVQPLVFDPDSVFPLRINLIPFRYLLEYSSRRDLLINIAGNFGMFVPSGIILPVICRKPDTFGKTAAAGFLLSLCIETAQLPFAVRATDIDDLILNTLGVMTGYGIYRLVKGKKKR